MEPDLKLRQWQARIGGELTNIRTTAVQKAPAIAPSSSPLDLPVTEFLLRTARGAFQNQLSKTATPTAARDPLDVQVQAFLERTAERRQPTAAAGVENSGDQKHSSSGPADKPSGSSGDPLDRDVAAFLARTA